MTNLELFLSVTVVVTLAALVFVGALLWRCFHEMKEIREHLSLINLDTDGQLEVLDRIDHMIESRIRAIMSGGEMENDSP